MFDDDDNGPNPQEIKAKIESMNAKCTIALEVAPTTGRRHYHVYAHKPTGFNTRSNRAFDISIFHPNIKLVARGHRQTWDYVTKGGNVVVEDVPRPEKASKKEDRVDEVFRTGLLQPSYQTMLRTIEDGAPHRFASSYLNIRACARDKFADAPEPEYRHPRNARFDTSAWPELGEWQNTYLGAATQRDSFSIRDSTPALTGSVSADSSSVFSGESGEVEPQEQAPGNEGLDPFDRYISLSSSPEQELSALQPRPKSLILWGPSRTGKTCWARSLGRHVHHASTVNMEQHKPGLEYAVFDDMAGGMRDFDYKAWLGGQRHFNITDKYMKKKSVTWGQPCIYICNEDPYVTERNVDLAWLSANTLCVHIDSSMY
jgi:hypothetical protein